jgi:acyl phosphate:glycerol-3-phosphate acyltransferase
MTAFLITAFFSYLLGSIPTGYILVRAFRGQDIRQTGSGNIGATNVARSSPLLGLITLLLDALKGLAAVTLARALFPGNVTALGLAALFAVIGHMFPVWLRFRGGKGVATGLGAFVMLAPKAVLLMVAVFLVIVAAFRYVSLGSIIAVAFLPLAAWFLDGFRHSPRLLLLTATASLLIIAKHHENVRRLAAGSENRFHWRRK